MKQLESEGASFEGADASFELLVRRRRPGYVAPFRIVDFTVIVEQRNGAPSRAEASVKVEVDGEMLHTAADGNGPVNALDLALRKALAAFYPALDGVHLVDYKVRIVDGEAATGARTRVIIETGARVGHVAHRRAPTRTSSPPRWRRSTTRSSTPSGGSTRSRSDATSGARSHAATRARSGRAGWRAVMTAVEPAPAARRGAAPPWARTPTSAARSCRSSQATVSIATHCAPTTARRSSRGSAPISRRTAARRCSSAASTTSGSLRNARLLRATVPESADALVEITLELLRRNAHGGDVYIRPLIYKAAPAPRPQLTGLDDRAAIYTFPLGRLPADRGHPGHGLRLAARPRQRDPGARQDQRRVRERLPRGGGRPRRRLRRRDPADRRRARGRGIGRERLRRDAVARSPPRRSSTTCCPASPVARSSPSRATPATTSSSDASIGPSSTSPTRSSSPAPASRWRRSRRSTIGPSADGFPVALDIQRRYFAAVRGTDPRYAAWLTRI